MRSPLTHSAPVLALLGLLAGCGQPGSLPEDDPLKGSPDFAAIARDVSSDEVASRQSTLETNGAGFNAKAALDTNQSFYLAIKKSQLGKRYFLSNYLKQYYPGAVSGGAAESMGTRIVSFQVQNGKLFVFDASTGTTTSDTFNPDLVIEAYPLVKTPHFDHSPNAGSYLLFDPAAGLNRFNLLSEVYGSAAVKFSLDLSFLQRFRQISDGVTFEQVFTGQADQPVGDGSIEPNVFRASGTLGVALRTYKESADYTPTPLPFTGEYYFRNTPVIVPNAGFQDQVAVKWNIHPGMKPIRWKISPGVLKVAQDPAFADIDVAGALKRGIENWNAVFGFKALEASIATEDVSFGDDDVNYVLFDEDPSYGAAFANWRTNPDTGEIRGASVYFSSLWLYAADYYFPADATVSATVKNLAALNKKPTLSWGKAATTHLCDRLIPLYALKDAKTFGKGKALDVNPNAALTPAARKTAIENYLTHVLVHEIGHTLGLRHNFKGSLVPPSSSVMEYVADEDAPLVPTPQAYDADAIHYLYGQSAVEPKALPFCTDEQVAFDADCTRFDKTADPLLQSWGPNYTLNMGLLLVDDPSSFLTLTTVKAVLKYIQAPPPGKASYAAKAWHILFDPVHAPLTAAQLASSPAYGPNADFFTGYWLGLLFPPGTTPSLPDAATTQLALAELRGNLLNLDGVRSFATRRQGVDVLKQFQNGAAFAILQETKVKLTVQLASGTLTGQAFLNTEDLLARVTAAISPYYL